MMMRALLLAGAMTALSAQPVEVYPVRSGPATQSLNGEWRFKYVAGSDLGPDAAFSDPAFAEAAAWKTSAVPGHWELQGFAEPRYGKQLAEGTGLYRRTFRVPADWSGRRVFLHFDGVLYGFDAWVNGTKVGSWASAYNPVAFDVTDALQPGADNVLAVRVTTRSHAWEFDTNDCWALSGIYRDVTLFAVPAAHLVDCTARTKLNPDGSASVSIMALTTMKVMEIPDLSGRLIAPDGQIASELLFSRDKPTNFGVSVQLAHPRLWTAEKPNLYTIELSITAPNQRPQVVREKIGLREITVVDGVLKLNGTPIKLHGVDHHDLWPVNGRVATEELMRRDLELMRAANINFIRTSHYPPHPRFLELCDELGFYVMDEVPFGFGDEHLTDPDYQPDLYTRARATVRRDRDHASVIVWSVGNENPNTPLTIATARRVKELDPTRPVCFPQVGSYFAKHYPELPDDIDIYSPHYPSLATVREYAATLQRPIIFTEYAHALGLASDQVQAQWAVMQASPRIAGGAIWMFQDQGILRTAAPGQTPGSTHELSLAVWPDAGHYYDGSGNQGMDGIVYADRTPQVDYWEVRKVYSPVQISAEEKDLVVRPGANGLTLQVENRHDFRALNGLNLAWSLVRDGQTVQSGSLPLQAAAHSTERVKVPVTWPANATGGFAWLALQVLDEHGVSFHERNFRLVPDSAVTPQENFLAGLPAEKLSLKESADAFSVTHPGFTLTLTRATGEITLRDAQGAELATGLRPHAGRRFTEGEFMRSKKELTWTGDLLAAAAGLETSAVRTSEGIALRVRGRYPRPGAPEQALEGEMNLLVRPNGTIQVGYDYTPVKAKGLLLEAGVALQVPAQATEFQWIGAGPYAGYPGKDALNEFGIYHLNRDDLNFSGNRRDVVFAALTTPQGAGVLLIPDQPGDIAVERTAAGTVFSHNRLLSGRGTKFTGPDTFRKSEDAPRIAGRFTLVPIAMKWPPALITWFGPPAAAKPFQPYFHSYDQ